MGILAGALRSAVNRHTGYTPNRLMLGREVNSPATLQFRPPPGESDQNGGEGEVSTYVANLEKMLRESHELARAKLRAAQKSMKRDYDLHIRERQYKVGDLVYWRRNAGKKVESVWLGPGVVIAMKSDTIYEVRTRRDVLILHHDKLKICQARELPKWIRDYQARTRVTVEPAGEEPKQSPPERNDKRGGESVVPKTDNPINAPFMGTRSRSRVVPKTSQQLQASGSQGRKRRGGKRKRYEYCVCKTKTPVGLMVQCDQCKDWFHPICVGRDEEEVRELSTYYCPDCTLVVEEALGYREAELGFRTSALRLGV